VILSKSQKRLSNWVRVRVLRIVMVELPLTFQAKFFARYFKDGLGRR
jgi:hypothetical protein